MLFVSIYLIDTQVLRQGYTRLLWDSLPYLSRFKPHERLGLRTIQAKIHEQSYALDNQLKLA